MGVITVEIPQPIKKTFRIEDVNAASALLRQLEDTSSDLLEELSGEVDRWEKEQDTATSGAIRMAQFDTAHLTPAICESDLELLENY